MLTEISIFAPHRCHGGKTTRSAFKCYCLFVRYVNILTGSVLDSPINQLSLWSLSIPCLQALCKAAIYPICVICQLMDRHSLWNIKTSRDMKPQSRDGFQAHYLPLAKTDLSFSQFNITVNVSFVVSLDAVACVSGLSCGLECFIMESDIGGWSNRAFSVHLCSLGLSVDNC